MLILFNPTRTAASHPPAARTLVDPEDADELAQILYPLPTTKDALNRILGTMGTAKGTMAFSQSLAHDPTPCPFHSIKSSKKRTVIYQPRKDTYLLVVFPRDQHIPEPMIEDFVRTAWDTATLLFGPDSWNDAAREWWGRFQGGIGDSVKRGLKDWVSGGVVADVETDGDAAQGTVACLGALQDRVAGSVGPVIASYAISLPDPDTDTNPTIYATPSTHRRTHTHKPLIHHLLDLLHTAQPPTPTTQTTRNRQRSPASTAEKPHHHQASKWTTLSLGTGISLFPSSSRSTSPATTASPSNLTPNPKIDPPKPKGIASWFGLGSSTSPSQERAAIMEDPIPITPVDVPSLDEALGTAQPINLRWVVTEVFLPDAEDEDAQRVDDEGKRLVRRVLVYTIHTRTLIALILDLPADHHLPDLLHRLNDPSTQAIQSSLSDLIRAIQAPSALRAATPSQTATQYIHSTSTPPHFTSNWEPHQSIHPSSAKDAPGSGRSRPGRETTVDSLGISARESLTSIDDAHEFFARTSNDVWIVGSRVPGSAGGEAEGEAAEEAYVVVQGRETSIVDAEYQLRKILKGQV